MDLRVPVEQLYPYRDEDIDINWYYGRTRIWLEQYHFLYERFDGDPPGFLGRAIRDEDYSREESLSDEWPLEPVCSALND